MAREKASDRKIAQIFSFPAFQAIPAPELPLQGVAHDKYMDLAKQLLRQSKLNAHTKRLCERLAVIHADLVRKLDHGASPSMKMMQEIDKLMRELKLVDESAETAPDPGQKENRFARFGIITAQRRA